MAKRGPKPGMTRFRLAILRAIKDWTIEHGEPPPLTAITMRTATLLGKVRPAYRQSIWSSVQWLVENGYILHEKGKHADWRITPKARRAIEERR